MGSYSARGFFAPSGRRRLARHRTRPRTMVKACALIAVLCVGWLVGTDAAQTSREAQSPKCVFYEAPFAQEYIAQLRGYDTLEAQERHVVSVLSRSACGIGLEVTARSPSAHEAPTDFVVLRMFSCESRNVDFANGDGDASGSRCHGSEVHVQNYVANDTTQKIKAIRVNKAYRHVQLLESGNQTKQQQRRPSQRLKTMRSQRTLNESTRELFGLRKPPPMLVDDLGVRALWDRGFKGQGVKVGIFDTGLSDSRLDNVKERINWTHEKKIVDSVGHGTFVAGVISGADDKCPGLAPEAEMFVFRMFTAEQLSFTSWYLDAFNYALFRGINVLNLSTGGPDFQDLPFVDKIKELAANGVILVSAVGNDGPHYGLLSNPADQAEVIGVGGITRSNEIAEFSSRGMTTWEFPFGSGRVKPDIVTLAEDVPGTDMAGGCKVMSGTSASAPIVSASVALLASMIPAESRWELVNPASIKQILLESADQLEARQEPDTHIVRNHIFEQGGGKLNLSRASELVEGMWSRHQNTSLDKPEVVSSVGKPSAFPGAIDATDCPRMWPICSQPLFHTSLPLMVNLTVLNPGSVAGTLQDSPRWIAGSNGELVSISIASPTVLWPYFGAVGVFIEVKESGSSFKGVAEGSLVLKVENNGRVDELVVPVRLPIVPTPPPAKRILWDQFHNIPYPSAFVPRDNLENEHDLMDATGDHLHTNFHRLWNFLEGEGFFVDILPFEYTCVDLARYGVVMVVDPEEDFFQDEIAALNDAIKYSGVSLLVFGDWYDDRLLNSLALFDTSTLSKWHAITGGANIPALNALLHEFHIAFGEGVVSSSSVSLLASGNDTAFPYWSGSYLANFPVGGYLGYIDAVDQSAMALNHSEQTLLDVPVLGLYEVPARNGGRIAVFGDSSCLDASVHSTTRFRDCFGMLRSLLRFTNDAVLPADANPQDQSATNGLQRLELEFTAERGALQYPLTNADTGTDAFRRNQRVEFAKHSKVRQAVQTTPRRSFCQFYRRQECVEDGHGWRVTSQAVT